MTTCPRCHLQHLAPRDTDFAGNGPDACLGYLPLTVAACCGHGAKSQRPYIMLSKGRISGDLDPILLPDPLPPARAVSLRVLPKAHTLVGCDSPEAPEGGWKVHAEMTRSVMDLHDLEIRCTELQFLEAVRCLREGAWETHEEAAEGLIHLVLGSTFVIPVEKIHVLPEVPLWRQKKPKVAQEVKASVSFKAVPRPVNPKLPPWEQDPRWDLVDAATGDVLDNAQGWGYTSAEKAVKAGWYKFKDGRKKMASESSDGKKWMAQHKEYAKRAFEVYEINFNCIGERNPRGL